MKSSCIGAGVMAAKFVNCSLAYFDSQVTNPLVMYGSMLCLTIVGICMAVVVREFVWCDDVAYRDEDELALQ